MNIFKKLFGRKGKTQKKDNECWYNDVGEKRSRDWSAATPTCSGSETYDGASLDMAITNQIAKR